jgi:hypothetical protein
MTDDMVNWNWDQVKRAFINYYTGVMKGGESEYGIVEDCKFDETVGIDEWYHRLLTLSQGASSDTPSEQVRDSTQFRYRLKKNLPVEYRRQMMDINMDTDTDIILERARMVFKMRKEERVLGKLSEKINTVPLSQQLSSRFTPADQSKPVSKAYVVQPEQEKTQGAFLAKHSHNVHNNSSSDRRPRDHSRSRDNRRFHSRSRSRSPGRFRRNSSTDRRSHCLECDSTDHFIKDCPKFRAKLKQEIKDKTTKDKDF